MSFHDQRMAVQLNILDRMAGADPTRQRMDSIRRDPRSPAHIPRQGMETALVVSQVDLRMGMRRATNRHNTRYRDITWVFELGCPQQDSCQDQCSLAILNPRMQHRTQRGRGPRHTLVNGKPALHHRHSQMKVVIL